MGAMKRDGFSLIEIVVVLSILSLLAAGGMLVLATQLRLAQRRGTEIALRDLHRTARQQSELGQASLRFDLTTHTTCLGDDGQPLEIAKLNMLVAGGVMFDSGVKRIEYANGGCRSYAILLGDASRGRWLVICGPTGQVESYAADKINGQQIAQWQTRWTHLN